MRSITYNTLVKPKLESHELFGKELKVNTLVGAYANKLTFYGIEGEFGRADFIHVDDEYEPEPKYETEDDGSVKFKAPTVLFMGGGWPDKKRQSEDRHKRNLAANPLYTTTGDWKDKMGMQ